MLNILLVTILLVFSNNSKTSESSKKTFSASKYFPLNKNQTIHYKSNFGDSEFVIKKVENEYHVKNSSDDFKYEQRLLSNNYGIYIIRTEQDVDLFLFFSSHKIVTYNQPALRYPGTFEIGKTWEWEGIEYIEEDSSKISIKGTVVGEELIKTEAGEFNCLKIITEIGNVDDKKDIVTEWLAEDIGIVKIYADVRKEGLIGLAQDLLGVDRLEFELKEIIPHNTEVAAQKE